MLIYMNKVTLYKISLSISLILITIGALFKITHYPGASFMLLLGMVVSFIFIIIALEEIFVDKSNSQFEKLLWLIAFIFLSLITGTVYYFNNIKSKT